ncbi:MAG: lysophospholipid acyltransferase family protein [Pseudomonadota bacterium]
MFAAPRLALGALITDTSAMLRIILGYVGTLSGLVLTFFWGTLAALGYPLGGQRFAIWCAHMWGRTVLRAGNVLVAVRGGDQLDLSRPHLYVSNHQSGLDILVLCGHLPQRVVFVAKKELARVPFVGWGLKLGGHVLIDRADRSQSYSALEAAGAEVRAGKSVIIFPEGTRSPPRELWPFKRGAMMLARAARVPIVPVGIVGSAERMKARQIYTTPGLVGVRIGQPILPEDFDDDDHVLIERVRTEIARLAGSSAAKVLPARGPHSRRAVKKDQGAPDEGGSEQPTVDKTGDATELSAEEGSTPVP